MGCYTTYKKYEYNYQQPQKSLLAYQYLWLWIGCFYERLHGGHLTYEHTGGADGFVTNTCFVPDENLGISILTNNDNQEFFELLRYQILDAYLGLPYRNYSSLSFARFYAKQERRFR